jgi:hypothetical protein
MGFVDQFLSIIVSAFAIIAGVYAAWRHFRNKPTVSVEGINEETDKNPILGLVIRFVELFEAHGIARTQR